MTTKEKLHALRGIMQRENLDAYIVSGTDPYNSEYLPAPWKQREWLSGFTGSFGTVVVTPNDAGLWTDTRYFIQAEKELQDSGISLHKLRIPGAVDYPEWLTGILPEGAAVGIDSFCTSVGVVTHLKEGFAEKNIRIREITDVFGELWMDRPALPDAPAMSLDLQYSGRSIEDKLLFVRKFLATVQADYILFSSLDEIAWLLNMRGKDIPYNPLVISYAIVGKDSAQLFVKSPKLDRETVNKLHQAGVEIVDYHHLSLFLDELQTPAVFSLDPVSLNYAIYNKVSSRFTIRENRSPVILEKAVKNQTEAEGFRKACLQDGIALTRFFHWLEKTVGEREVSETEAAEQLAEFRRACSDYVSDSFHTISAYGKNAALPHYSAVPGKESVLERKGLYLLDSGGQYLYGTTDITRTIPLGELTQAEKEDYTLVLKGMIALTTCVFPKGTSGAGFDIVARYALWKNKKNYGHGTGHGIGHFLCVHEGPQEIRQNWKEQPFLPGMVTSNEPAVYVEGQYGIRHENMLLCTNESSNQFGDWLAFETLTLCYFDTTPLLSELLTEEEKKWLNDYHALVFNKISPFLTPEETAWLKTKTLPVQSKR